MNLYWGDLHAHCAVSYGQGTPQAALANAQQHLDFCSITGHAFWPDIPLDVPELSQGVREHLDGFAKLKRCWKSLMRQLDQANEDGRFVTFPSYEWHCLKSGDHNCYFDRCNVELLSAPTVRELAEKLDTQDAEYMILPHHCAYVSGYRALDWKCFDEKRSPLIEIYSSHGCCESDDAPYEYHLGIGPRVGDNLLRKGLLAGHRFGFLASTDNHHGYPGHYGHGCVGVFAGQLNRRCIWEGLKNRRTIASTGARIAIEMQLGSGGIGDILPRGPEMPLTIRIDGTYLIDRVELIEASGSNWRLRRLPLPAVHPGFEPGRYKVKVETGWGLVSPCSEWSVLAAVENGRLLSCVPCFRFSQFDASESPASNRIIDFNDHQVHWTCKAASNPAGMIGGTHLNPGGTQAVVLEVEASEATCLRVTAGKASFNSTLKDLAEKSTGQHVGAFASPAIKIHRAIPQREFSYCYSEPYVPIDSRPGLVYLRVSQSDGQVAWASPIWFE